MRALLVFAIACGSSKAPSPVPSGPPASTLAPPAKNDVQVATVNGKPVWGSCVTAQSARGAKREQALQQCIDFELLAQAADARALAADPEVVLATRTALVSQLVAFEYEDKYQRPEEFGTFWTRMLERNKLRFDHPEARGSVFVRVPLDKNASPAADAKAKQWIDEIYAALEDERGLMKPHVDEISERVIAGRAKLQSQAVPPDIRNGRLDETYTKALFEIKEVGRAAPPVKTPWGWDIVVWDSVVPARKATQEEVVKEALPEIKRSFFPQWVNKIIAERGVRIEVVEANVQKLEDL